MSPSEIDKIICEWSMENGIALTEEQLNTLVDKLADVLERRAERERESNKYSRRESK
jgi:hypothetical protein